MSKTSKSSNNELIKKRKKKRVRRRIIWLFIFMIGVFILFSLKTNYFYVNKVVVEGNTYVDSKELVDISGITKSTNILYLDSKKIKSNISKSSYINSVTLKRKLPNTIIIQIEERTPKYIVNLDDKVYILDRSLYILEIRKDNPLGLTEVIGLNIEGKTLGDRATDSDRIGYFIENYTGLMDILKDPIIVNKIDLRDTLKIQLIINKITIKLGDEEDLEEKLNKSFNIINQEPSILEHKGYIDVSFNGNPVYSIEK